MEKINSPSAGKIKNAIMNRVIELTIEPKENIEETIL